MSSVPFGTVESKCERPQCSLQNDLFIHLLSPLGSHFTGPNRNKQHTPDSLVGRTSDFHSLLHLQANRRQSWCLQAVSSLKFMNLCKVDGTCSNVFLNLHCLHQGQHVLDQARLDFHLASCTPGSKRYKLPFSFCHPRLQCLTLTGWQGD